MWRRYWPEGPLGADGNADPELTVGRDLWAKRCASCHGGDGGGGSGPKLSAGKLAEKFPAPLEQKQLILEGGNGMPAFAGKLGDDEIEGLLRYIREVLG